MDVSILQLSWTTIWLPECTLPVDSRIRITLIPSTETTVWPSMSVDPVSDLMRFYRGLLAEEEVCEVVLKKFWLDLRKFEFDLDVLEFTREIILERKSFDLPRNRRNHVWSLLMAKSKVAFYHEVMIMAHHALAWCEGVSLWLWTETLITTILVLYSQSRYENLD